MNKKLKIVSDNYIFKTNKIYDLYYKEPYIRKLVDIMIKALEFPVAKKIIADNIWYLEDLSRVDFNLIVSIAKSGKLPEFCTLIDWIAKE